jgi:DNA-binding IclR family transcriptional regulator
MTPAVATTISAEHAVKSRNSRHFRLPAVDRAMNLLELLAVSRNGLTLSELSRKLDIPKSTAHYLIYTLSTRGYVQRTSNGRHSLGLRLTGIAGQSRAEIDLSAMTAPYLREVSARVNLTATASILKGAEAVIIGRSHAFQDTGGGAWVGRHLDLHCTAQGKALLSGLSDEDLNRMLMRRELAQFTSKTIISLEALKLQLAEVRTKGYAVNDEEQVHGVRAVAAPVLDSLGNVITCISVRGSVDQIPRARFPELGKEMIRAARDMALLMSGY